MFGIPTSLITSEPQIKFFVPTWMQLPEGLKKNLSFVSGYFLNGL